jgi:tetratricopeptide (TPR) repeat protein
MKRPQIRWCAPWRAAAILAVVAMESGCASRAVRPAVLPSPAAIVHPEQVTGDQFASVTADILKTRDATAARTNRLVGVVNYQLGRAGDLFDGGHEEAGLSAVEGALFLVRAGEAHPAMFEGRTSALMAAANAVARRGTEGRALALYSTLARILPKGADLTEVVAHLTALKSWEEGTRSRGELQAAGGDERSTVGRALWDPSEEAVQTARAAIVTWIDRAIDYSKEQVPPTDDFERDEAIEAYRAVRTGAMALAALYLRNGNPTGALEAMDMPHVARVVSPHLRESLRRAAEESDPEAWLELFTTFDRLGSVDADVALDPELSQGAAWGAAVELFRVEPATMRGVMPLATLLMRHGMSEIAPSLLTPVVVKVAHTDIASWSLGYVLEALMSHDAVGDLAAARRTFREAVPLLDYVEKQPIAKDVTPSVARLRYAMGSLEARSGDLSAARPLVDAAAKSEPSLPGFELLAAIDRQKGAASDALRSLDAVAKIATETSDPGSVAGARLAMYQIYRDQNDVPNATKEVEAALRRALDARQLARTGPEQASAERTLARVLEEYGAVDAARRATSRAYEASSNDQRQLTATVLEAARRGLVTGDLRTARDAARRAIDANVAPDDLVYVALWLRLLERKLGTPSDGTVEEAFAKIDDDAGWAARLRAWGAGRLTGDQLLAAARGRVEETEASFYVAMAALVGGDARGEQSLQKIAKSESIELVEVSIARDLATDRKRLDLKIPAGIEVP